MNILLAVVFLAGNAVFVGAQFALITARHDQVEPMTESGNRRAAIALRQMRALDRMLAGSQLGIALCSLGLGAVAEPAFAHQLERLFDALSLPQNLLHPVAFVLALAFVSFCHMVLGEMVPKNLALAGPATAALWLAPPMSVWTRVTGPLLRVISALANGLLRLFGVRVTSELRGPYTAEEFSHLVDESAAEGLLAEDERDRLQQALALDVLTARDVVLPTDRLVTLTPDATVGQLEHAIATSGYSRYPLCDGTRILGYVHAKDLLWLADLDAGDPLPESARRPLTPLPAEATLAQALTVMQRQDTHMAQVVEAGDVLGVITLEDVLERLLGEVRSGSA